MKIIKKEDTPSVSKPEGTNVRYYLRDEYEVHFNEQIAGSEQVWHYHDKIFETLLVVEGELTAKWKVGDKVKSQIIKKGDLIETENTLHTFSNHTDKIAKFIVIKQVLSGANNREVFKADKIVEQAS